MNFINTFIFVSTVIASTLAEEFILKTSTKPIEGSYLVKLNSKSRITLDTHIAQVESLFTERNSANKIQSIFKNLGNAYHAHLTKSVLDKVKSLPEVELVTKDSMIKVQTIQEDASWALARISQRNFTKKTTYTYDGDGEGVSVYIIDTGVFDAHPEFEGRVRHGPYFSGNNTADEFGHGTHVAGLIGSKTYGVAKKAELISIKIIDGTGQGQISSLISGLDWILGDKGGKKGKVVNLSLGGNKDESLNAAIETAYTKGLVIVAAAGNEYTNACNKSPASAPNAIAVGATDEKDETTYFTNYGKCVDILAPGDKIPGPWKDGSIQKKSGTSMASPIVAGLAAYYMSKETLTNAQVTQKILSTASKGFIKYLGGSPNLLAYNNIA